MDVGHLAEPRISRVLLCSILYAFASTSILAYLTWCINANILHGIRATFLWSWFFVLTVYLRAIFVFLDVFFAAFIFFGFLLLPSKLSGIVKSPLEVASTLQDHCLPQTIVTEPNFIQGIFSTLSNLLCVQAKSPTCTKSLLV